MSDYYNTNHLDGDDLQGARMGARHQEIAIARFFREHPDAAYTPWEVSAVFRIHNWPITSVRRAITNLTEKGQLRKTKLQKPGPLGKPSYCWQWVDQDNPPAVPAAQQSLF